MDIRLRPEFRTPGGEVLGIYDGQQWMGDAYVLYRYGDALAGTVQLDEAGLSTEARSEALALTGRYMRDLARALSVREATVVGLQGNVHTVFDLSGQMGLLPDDADADADVVWDSEPVESGDDPYDYSFWSEGSGSKPRSPDDSR